MQTTPRSGPQLAAPPAGRPARGPVTDAERSLAPDLARGIMLAFIALANSPLYLHARPRGLRLHIIEDSVVDTITTFLVVTFVDGRAYPMFAALFGYGMVQLYQRQVASGGTWPAIQSLLVRRNLWLLVFGLLHALLLFSGDILGAYALAGLLALALFRMSDTRLLAAAAVFALPLAGLGATYGLVVSEDQPSMVAALSTPDPLDATEIRLTDWIVGTPYSALVVMTPMLVGIWAGRRGLLEDPARHRRLLRRVAVVGLTVAVVGGLPLDLRVVRVLPSYSLAADLIVAALHTLTGVAGGLGYAALIGLIAARFAHVRRSAADPADPQQVTGSRDGAGRNGSRLSQSVVRAVAACGQRSLSCYLAQSVVFVAVFTPYLGGLGATTRSAGAAVIALATWLATVVAADVLRRLGRRGPAETLLRRLVYSK